MEKLIERKRGKKIVQLVDDGFGYKSICVCSNGFQTTCIPVDLDIIEMLVSLCPNALSYLREIESKKD